MSKILERIYLKQRPNQDIVDMPFLVVTDSMRYIIIDVFSPQLGKSLETIRVYPADESHIIRGEN